MASNMQLLQLQPWQRSFYEGSRLAAEVELHGSALVGDVTLRQLTYGCALLLSLIHI